MLIVADDVTVGVGVRVGIDVGVGVRIGLMLTC